ncbi:hypothetical protein A4G20_01860 [Pasteurellaceae bacterium RH1A]|nr:hypothetical protein A4G20_01860 [Pasteurellaceae bacterium RH1A]
MQQEILNKLTQIEADEALSILLAVESGSRAWGFASPDSDFDVRAIYIRPKAWYLQIDEQKDTFEFIENQWFDVGGWDLRKVLVLLRKSNAVLLEWLRSPIIYQQDNFFVQQLNQLLPLYVQAAPLLHHYRGVAGNTLKDVDLFSPIRLKKWFYILRSLLAARWVVYYGGVPPMTLLELLSDWQVNSHQEIIDLVALKSQQDEGYLHQLSPHLRHLTLELWQELQEITLPPAKIMTDSEPLNHLFRQMLERDKSC